ncbi:unnamed protein product [Trichobilharzia regenti]|nr:unnamed protein product [Trichobilharzia regenti]
MSFDDKHQQERAIILGSRADSSPYTTYQSNSSSSMSGIGGGSNSSSIGNNFLEGGDLPLNYANESLDDFELTCHDVYLDDDTQSHSTLNTPSSSSPSISSVKPATNQQSFDINRSVTAPLSAGIRGLMHGIVGGMTSIVTQPYRGAKEDQFKVSNVLLLVCLFVCLFVCLNS